MNLPFCYIENEIHALGLGLWGRLQRLNDNLPVITEYQKRELFNATLNDPDRQIIIINTCRKENLFDDIDKARQFLFHRWKYLVYATLIPITSGSGNEIISLSRSVMGVDYNDAAKVLRKNWDLYYELNARFRNKTISIQDKRRIWPIYKALEAYLNIPPQNGDESIDSYIANKINVQPTKPNQYIEDNIFRRKGEFLETRYQEKDSVIKHSSGMKYINYLMKNESNNIFVIDLSKAVDGGIVDSNKYYAEMTNEQLETLGMRRVEFEKDINAIDEKTKTNVKNQIEKLKEDLRKAKENNNFVEEESVHLEIYQLEEYIISSIGKDGKIRKLHGGIEKERKRISIAIQRALSDIKKEDEVLYRHINNSIKTGLVFSYTPEKSMSWKFN